MIRPAMQSGDVSDALPTSAMSSHPPLRRAGAQQAEITEQCTLWEGKQDKVNCL